MAKLWGGRFDASPSEELFAFASAEDAMLDQKLAAFDVQGNLAHVAMLAKQKIISKEEAKAILSSLLELQSLAEKGKFAVDPKLEDVHTNVEDWVTKKTAAGKKMHTARSRNDQVSLDTRLYMREAINELSAAILALQQSLALLAKNDLPFPAYTHFQVALPVSLSFWAHAHWNAFERDLARLSELYARVNENPLGSGAVAGTTWPIDRNYTSKLLGFTQPTANPMDTVSARGELEAELLATLTISLTHASRIAEDVILLANKRLIILPDQYSTGSSMMPQKKNPDPFELIRGRASRMLGLFVHTASLSKGLPTGYNRDTQEAKYTLLSGVDTAMGVYSILAKALPLLKFNQEKITEELEEGFACTTELADLLAKKGVPFRTAHEIAGKLVKECMAKKKYLSQLTAKEVSSAAGVAIPEKELAEATSTDKVKRYSSQYKISAKSEFADKLSARKKALAEAEAFLQKEVKSITG